MTHSTDAGTNGVPPGAGVLPVIPSDGPLAQAPTSHAATGATAASTRALVSQAIAFYFRAPVKAFFRTRVDYLAYARAIHEQQTAAYQAAVQQLDAQQHGKSVTVTPSALLGRPVTANAPRLGLQKTWHWLKTTLRGTTPAVLATAVRHHGWSVIPDQVMPPLIANVGVGAVLYTTYLQVLGQLHEGSSKASKRVYPPPLPLETFTAGFLAGAIQSVVAVPLDAVQARYDLGSTAAGMTGSGNPLHPNGNCTTFERPKSMWRFSYEKLREIGVRGIFAGWGLSFLKDSLGCAVFFSTFEYVKAQGYYRFVAWYYGGLGEDVIASLSRKRPPHPKDLSSATDNDAEAPPTVIRPHYAIEPAFLMLAGVGASIAQQALIHPLSHIQVEHWERLEMLDAQARRIRQRAQKAAEAGSGSRWRWGMWRAYYHAYRETWAKCVAEAETAGLSTWRWLYRGFWWNTVRQVPSTSAGLIIFELVRRKYGMGGEEVRISKDRYDILLT